MKCSSKIKIKPRLRAYDLIKFGKMANVLHHIYASFYPTWTKTATVLSVLLPFDVRLRAHENSCKLYEAIDYVMVP